MKINISDTAEKKYYNEFYWILLNYDELRSEPRSRVHFATTRPLVYSIISIIMIIIFGTSLAINGHLINTYPLVFFSLVLIASVSYLIYVTRIINKYHSIKGKRSLQIAKYFVEVQNESGKYRLLWRDTNYVLFNRYTICFIPKDPTKILISTRIEYKKEIKKALRAYSKRRFIIDNSDLYKREIDTKKVAKTTKIELEKGEEEKPKKTSKFAKNAKTASTKKSTTKKTATKTATKKSTSRKPAAKKKTSIKTNTTR